MTDESFYRLQAYLLHEHDVLLSVQTLEAVAADVNWDDTVSDEVRNLTTDEGPQEIEAAHELTLHDALKCKCGGLPALRRYLGSVLIECFNSPYCRRFTGFYAGEALAVQDWNAQVSSPPIPYQLTPEGRAIAAAYKKRKAAK